MTGSYFNLAAFQKFKPWMVGLWLWILVLVPAVSVMAAERYAVTAETANIRSGPGTKYDILWKVERYYPLLVLEKRGVWYRFKDFEGDQGWIHKSLVGKVKTVVVKADKCNVRSGPGTKYGVVFKVDSGVPFKVLGKKGPWLHVRHADGDEGWIHSTLVW